MSLPRRGTLFSCAFGGMQMSEPVFVSVFVPRLKCVYLEFSASEMESLWSFVTVASPSSVRIVTAL